MFGKMKSDCHRCLKSVVHGLSGFKGLAKEGSWIIIGQISAIGGALVLVRVLTHYLAPAQYGELALGLTVAGFVNQVVSGGITAGIGRFYAIAAEKQDLAGYLHATRELLGYATAAVAVIGLILMASLYWLGYSHWIGLAAAALVFSVLSGYNGALSGIQNAARQRAIVALHSGLDAWLKILLAVGVVLWLGASSTAVLIGFASSSLLIAVSQLIFLRRTIPKEHTPIPNPHQWMPQIWAYSLPFTTWGVFTWLQQVSDRWALQTFASTSDVGRYALLFQLGFTPIALITSMVMSFVGPILYQRSGDATDQTRNANVHRFAWRITRLSLIVTVVGFAITFVLHEWIFGLLVAPEFWGSSSLLPWVVLAGGMFAAGQMLALKLMSEMKASAMTTAKIVTALIGLLLNIVGASIVGMLGVVVAIVASSCIYLIWMAVLTRRLSIDA